MSGGETAEPIAQYYIQVWKDIGVNVELTDGQLMEMNAFYDRVQADDKDIDVYQAAWGTGGDPNPTGFFGKKEAFNFMRWEDEKNTELLAKISSSEAFDEDFKQQAFYEWQEYIMEEVPLIPTLYRQNVYAVNKRVGEVNVKIGEQFSDNLHELYLIAKDPVKN